MFMFVDGWLDGLLGDVDVEDDDEDDDGGGESVARE
eukprot:CAMPEP_0182504086 /NCGR_PEP_ID=MMETSP1321-20130603/16553_1 /TAXON_ID=91990 /ORGANISM="Bolidomonas sp., Strain RCC1657" /LENGTH=35 /DNA_ID= /DNA_START= /DNA_END= /DNA_ORIENTATION=